MQTLTITQTVTHNKSGMAQIERLPKHHWRKEKIALFYADGRVQTASGDVYQVMETDRGLVTADPEPCYK